MAAETVTRTRTLVVGISLSAAVVVTALFSNRIFLWLWYSSATGALAGTRLHWLYLLPALTGAIAALFGFAEIRRATRRSWWWVPYAVIAADLVVAVIAGTRIHLWQSVLVQCAPALGAAGVLTTGIVLAAWDRRFVDWTVAVTAGVSAITGFVQLAGRAQLYTPVTTYLADWDRQMLHYSPGQFTYGRAEGFDINPDSYSLLGAVCLLWAVMAMPRGWLKNVTVVASLFVLALGQSRTTVVLAAIVLAMALIDAIRRRVPLAQIAKSAGLLLLAVALVVAATGAILSKQSAISARSRLTTGAQATLGLNSSADTSLATRIDMWRLALKLYPQAPLGMWEHVGAKMPLSPHNEFLLRLLYAGPLYLLALIAFIVWLFLGLRPAEYPLLGTTIAVFLIASAMVQDSTHSLPFATIGWLVVGAGLALASAA